MICYCDLHLHSALSPCGDSDMTPNNIVNMAALCGLDFIAVTDHNTVGNVGAVMRVAEEKGVLVVPGMELETAEEAHFVCLFETLSQAEAFEAWLSPYRLNIKNKVSLYGEQQYLNEKDEVVGVEERLLVTAATCSVYDAAPQVKSLGGVMIPAHVDKTSYSVIQSLGTVPSDLGFTTVEISKNITKKEAIEKFPYLSEFSLITNSDSHYLDSFYETENPICVEEKTIKSLIDALKRK